jgi:hypothetical protein
MLPVSVTDDAILVIVRAPHKPTATIRGQGGMHNLGLSMKDLFAHFYRPSDDEFRDLWDRCLFVPDTNVLLNAYRYTQTTRDTLFEVLGRAKDRLWLTYQAAYEFHRRRPDVIHELGKPYQDAINALDNIVERARKARSNERRLASEMCASITGVVENAKQALTKEQQKYPREGFNSDEVRDRLTDLFAGRVETEPPKDEMDALCRDIEDRYKRSIPPGYEDKEKPVPDRYGDAIIWLRTIRHAKANGTPVVFVTDDAKDDWWWTVGGMTVGPRSELLKEFREATGQPVWVYHSDSFLDQAFAHFKLDGSASDERKAAVAEIKAARVTLVRHKPVVSVSKRVLPTGLLMATYHVLRAFQHQLPRQKCTQLAKLLNSVFVPEDSPEANAQRFWESLTGPQGVPALPREVIDAAIGHLIGKKVFPMRRKSLNAEGPVAGQ